MRYCCILNSKLYIWGQTYDESGIKSNHNFISRRITVFGGWTVNRKIPILKRFCIPAPVVGGLLFAILVTIFRQAGLINLTLDTTLQSLFMLTFFTTVGLGASFKLVKLGGKLLVIYWLACGALALFQSMIGVSLATVLDLEPLLGVVMGPISMEGGHGAATAFGGTIEDLGVSSALSIGLAAATFGLVAGGLAGGPSVKYLITKYKLQPSEADINDEVAAAVEANGDSSKGINAQNFMYGSRFLLRRAFLEFNRFCFAQLCRSNVCSGYR